MQNRKANILGYIYIVGFNMLIFAFPNLFSKKHILHSSATAAWRKTVFFKTLLMKEFRQGLSKTLINIIRVTVENVHIFIDKDCQIPVHADMEQHYMGMKH